MPASVLLITDRTGFEPKWRDTCEQIGMNVRLARPADLASAVGNGVGVVLDAASAAYDEDELLACAGLVRAVGGVPVVHLADTSAMRSIEDVLDDICGGLVVRMEDEVSRFAGALSRRLERERDQRFEFLTISPRGGELLAVLGDGRCLLVKRPVDAQDDLSEVTSIELAEDARSATLQLAGGASVRLEAADVLSKSPAISLNGSHANGLSALLPIDGVKLGARLRELRLAAGLTQAELARRTGIHRPNIARVEAGRHTPSLDTLARLASAIGVPTTHVLSVG